VPREVLDRDVTDAPGGHVDDAQERDLVRRIGQHLEVGEDVAHLAPVEELGAAHHLVADAQGAKRLLERTGLAIGAVEDRQVVGSGAARQPLLDGPGDVGRLLVLTGKDHQLDPGSPHRGGPQLLRPPLRKLRDDSVRRLEHRRHAPVVLLQADLGGARERLLEAEDVPDLRTSPAVDALIVVADGADVAALARELADQLQLCAVGVLELVDQEVPKSSNVPAEHVGVLAEEAEREQEQIVEVHRSLGLERPLVEGEDLGRGELRVARGIPLGHRGPAGVLGPADGGEDAPGVEVGLSVDGPLPERALDQSDLVRGVGDGEPPRRRAGGRARGGPRPRRRGRCRR
jgi:hypothetical protein